MQRDCVIITWKKGGGVGKPEGGHRRKLQLEGGEFDVKFNTWRGGAFLFSQGSFSQTGKVVEETLEFKYLYLLTLELNWENMKNSRCFDL